MIWRLGIVGRLLATGFLGFGALLVVLGALLYLLRAQEGALERAFPLPAQVAAIVELVDHAPAATRETLLDALDSPTLTVRVYPGAPVTSAGSREVPRLENFLARYGADLAGREMVVDIPDDTGNNRPLLNAWRGRAPLRIQVALADGNHLLIEARGEPVRRWLGLPSGFWLAALGTLIAAVTLIGLYRSARPLRQLTGALETFSETASPVPLKPSGRPDVQRLMQTFNRMQERLSALVKGRTILAGAISHDLRTYLTRLRLRVEAIDDAAERAGAEGDIDAMTDIVENALVFAQAASGGAGREVVDLGAVTADEKARLEREGARVSWRLPEAPVAVEGDRVALGRVVANLIDNALRYAGEAEVELSSGDAFAELVVDDHGPGIPPGEREAVFEPFYRLERSRNRASGGTGLGLALTRQIVEAHGGRITATDAPGGGTRMRVLLPLAR